MLVSLMDLDRAVVIALGANLTGPAGAPQHALEAALDQLTAAGLVVVRRSRWWRSRAWPDPAQPDYLNGVALVETSLTADQTLEALHAIEAAAGRERRELNEPRILDLDLIACGREIRREPAIAIPHPRAADRLFVMGPLAEIAPDWRHPITGETAQALAERATIGTDAAPLD